MGDQWELCTQGSAGGPVRWGTSESCVSRVTLGDQWHGRPMITVYPGLRWGTNDMGDQWEPCTQGCVGGPVTWGTNENRLERVKLGDQWDGGPMRIAYPELHWGTNEMGDQWELRTQVYIEGSMRCGTSANCVPRVTLGDQWDGGPMTTVYPGWGDQRVGRPMRWGTNGLGDVGANWGTNEMGDQWDGGPSGWTCLKTRSQLPNCSKIR